MRVLRAVLFSLVLVGCGGVVVVEGDDVEEDGSGSEQPFVPRLPGPIPESDAPTGACLADCGAWMGACEDDRRCAEPRDVCRASEAELAKDVVACVCAGCAERCGGDCALFNLEDASCLECQQTMIRQTCNFEYYACVGF